MALTIAPEGLGVLSDAESTTGWGITGSGGSSITSDTEIYYQGSASVSSQISSGKNGWIWYNYGSGLNFTTTYNGQLVYIWYQCTTPGKMNTLATPGLSVRMGSSTTAYGEWTIAGSDDLNGYVGGWKCAVIDPNTTPTNTAGGWTSPTSLQYFGIYYNGAASARSNNVFVDTIMVGSGVRASGTETTSGDGYKEIVAYCTALATRVYGTVQEREGIYYLYGKLYLGSSARNTTISDSSRVLKWGDYEYWSGSAWVSGIGDGYNGLSIEDDASYTTSITDGVLVGTDAGRSGNVYIGSLSIDTTISLAGGNNASSLTYLYADVFTDIDGGITWADDAQHRMYSCTLQTCGQFDPVGAPIIRNSLFTTTIATDACLLWNESINIQNCKFIANTTGAGIEHPSAAGTPYTYNSLTFSGNTYDVNNTSGSAISIGKEGTSDPTSYTGSTVTFTASYTLTMTDIVSGTEVTIVNSSTRTELDNQTSAGSDLYYSHSGGETVDILLIHVDYDPNLSSIYSLTLPNSSSTIKFQQIDDPNYYNP